MLLFATQFSLMVGPKVRGSSPLIVVDDVAQWLERQTEDLLDEADHF